LPGSGKAEKMGEKKQATSRVEMTAVTRFLYMVVLYMAPKKEICSTPGQRAGIP
jgi:hypothetical protein